ncbi:MAG: sigma-54-dependent Fis family transcriptional regulator [Planctomycetes bacterium]|nr:sigma-54-dependent Fis family transcriptional regulator [Planctomycetota bacterium]
MPRLVVKEGYNRGAVFDLASDSLSIGRDLDNSIQVIDDKVSRTHAKIYREGMHHVLIDNRSRNGTTVNGLPIDRRPLKHGDEVRIGDTLFLFLGEVEGSTAPRFGSRLSGAEPALSASYAPGQREEIVGASKAMLDMLRQVSNCAAADAPVLLVGEPGTGKELLARTIHLNGGRREAPFVVVNCGALAEPALESEIFGHERGAHTGAVARKLGSVELAGHGTLYLDQVSEAPFSVQSKLFRLAENREFMRAGGTEILPAHCRLLTAATRDLAQAVARGEFRPDLHQALNVTEVRIPPLRERPDDIPPLVEYFFRHFRNRLATRMSAIAADALARLKTYSWPGNVRELRNAIERAMLAADGDTLALVDLPFEVRLSLQETPERVAQLAREVERRLIVRVLRAVRGDRTAAAQALGVEPKQLVALIEAHRIVLPTDSAQPLSLTPAAPPPQPPLR